MTDSVMAELKDIGQEEGVLGRQLALLHRRREYLLRSRIKPTERQVADHAIVRFIERVDGVDLEAIKSRIRAYAEECSPTGVNGILRHPSGTRVVTNVHGLIVTILPPGEDDDYPSKDFEQGEKA